MLATISITLLMTTLAPEPALPEHRDIPADFSAVICPDAQSASTMLKDYYRMRSAPDNHRSDTDLFFKGITATGCEQKSTLAKNPGEITIDKVVRRVTLQFKTQPNRFIHFLGRDAQGETVHGIVDEDWNNRFARTDLAKWKQSVADDGWLDARRYNTGSYRPHFYRCDTVATAREILTKIKSADNASEATISKALKSYVAKAGCTNASDRYFVTAKHENVGINCGFECYLNIYALEATDSAGLPAGLIFDGSPF